MDGEALEKTSVIHFCGGNWYCSCLSFQLNNARTVLEYEKIAEMDFEKRDFRKVCWSVLTLSQSISPSYLVLVYSDLQQLSKVSGRGQLRAALFPQKALAWNKTMNKAWCLF